MVKVFVVAPPADFRTNKVQTLIWDGYGNLHQQCVKAVGPDMAFSLALSRFSRELRREVGWEAAREVFLGFAANMEEASKNDLEGD